MPASDYDARALALPIDDEERATAPSWSRHSSTRSFARNSTAPHRGRSSLRQRATDNYFKLSRRVTDQYNKLSPVQKVLVVVGGIASIVLGILFLVYNERIFGKLLPVAKRWRDVKGGWVVIWALIFIVSFPPLIGYSSLLTVTGFVYGFPNGWYIAASATIVGSTTSFLLSRSLFKNYVDRLIANDTRFAALSLTLKHDGLKLLVMIRMCPLPYSLSNGAIATFPTVHWASFALATALVSPKLMLHIFIGAQLEKIAESGGKMDPHTKALSYVSIAIGAVAGVATGWLMYRKTKERARELEEEERQGVGRVSIDDLQNEYADDPATWEAAEMLREDDDDISLRTTWDDEYHDEPETSDALEIGDDPFSEGGRTDEEDGREVK